MKDKISQILNFKFFEVFISIFLLIIVLVLGFVFKNNFFELKNSSGIALRPENSNFIIQFCSIIVALSAIVFFISKKQARKSGKEVFSLKISALFAYLTVLFSILQIGLQFLISYLLKSNVYNLEESLFFGIISLFIMSFVFLSNQSSALDFKNLLRFLVVFLPAILLIAVLIIIATKEEIMRVVFYLQSIVLSFLIFSAVFYRFLKKTL